MRLLLSSKEKRQLELMEYLMSSRKWTHIKILSEKFMCTERILKQDIAELREAFPHIDIQSSTNGIKAYFTKETSLQDIYRYFFSNSQNYSLLEYMKGKLLQKLVMHFIQHQLIFIELSIN